MWKKDLRPEAEAYALRRGLELTGVLGDGTEGNVWKVRRKGKLIAWAVKMHHSPASYANERDCYRRLMDGGVFELEGCSVPTLLGFDDESLALEMSIVDRPYVLDFAQATLDVRPDFSNEVWEETLTKWREDYGDDWLRVQRLLWRLESLGIYYLDVHRGNIALALPD